MTEDVMDRIARQQAELRKVWRQMKRKRRTHTNCLNMFHFLCMHQFLDAYGETRIGLMHHLSDADLINMGVLERKFPKQLCNALQERFFGVVEVPDE